MIILVNYKFIHHIFNDEFMAKQLSLLMKRVDNFPTNSKLINNKRASVLRNKFKNVKFNLRKYLESETFIKLIKRSSEHLYVHYGSEINNWDNPINFVSFDSYWDGKVEEIVKCITNGNCEKQLSKRNANWKNAQTSLINFVTTKLVKAMKDKHEVEEQKKKVVNIGDFNFDMLM